MLIPAKDFFDNLPVKMCCKCGGVMEEQTECYETICLDCQDSTMFKPFASDPSAL